MGAYFNEVIIIGDYHKRIEDIQLKSGGVGVQVVIFCQNEYYDKNGSKRTREEHIAVVAWGKSGDMLASKFGPGDRMLIRGTLGGREYSGRYYTQVSVNHVQHFDGFVSASSAPKKRSAFEPNPVASEPDAGAAPKAKEEDSDLPF